VVQGTEKRKGTTLPKGYERSCAAHLTYLRKEETETTRKECEKLTCGESRRSWVILNGRLWLHGLRVVQKKKKKCALDNKPLSKKGKGGMKTVKGTTNRPSTLPFYETGLPASKDTSTQQGGGKKKKGAKRTN